MASEMAVTLGAARLRAETTLAVVAAASVRAETAVATAAEVGVGIRLSACNDSRQ